MYEYVRILCFLVILAQSESRWNIIHGASQKGENTHISSAIGGLRYLDHKNIKVFNSIM